MTRVRYQENEGILYSGDFLAIDKMVSIALHRETLEGYIVLNENDIQKAIRSFKARNLAELKKLAKKELVLMGVTFKDEVRTRIDSDNKEYVKEQTDAK